MSTSAEPGRLLNDRYRLVEHLARGGMATVWVGEDTLLARKVAVKTLHPELAAQEAVRARFRNEAIAAAGLAHPGIVTTYDTGEDDGVAYIVMELVSGKNVRQLLDERGPLPVGDAVRIARGVAVALDDAHRHGIVHRDVKPANVLVPAEGPVKVTDFGIAKAAGAGDLTTSGTIIGTARYLAPEQVRGEPADGRADVYAVGLLLHEMLAGELPFHGDTEMASALARLTTPPAPLPAGVPESVKTIVARCLAVDPDQRWPSAHALASALDVAAKGGDVPAATIAPPTRDPTGARGAPPAPPVDTSAHRAPRSGSTRPVRRRKRTAWPWAIVGGVLIGAGAGGGYLLVKELTKNNASGSADAAPVHLASASDFDPFGNNGQERPDLVSLAVDGDPTTAWRTETYSSPDLGGKQGVGLYVVLDSATDVSFVEVDTVEPNWSASIYVAESPASTLAGWGEPVATGEGFGTTSRFEIDPPRHGGAVLVWITRVPNSGRLQVAEVRVG